MKLALDEALFEEHAVEVLTLAHQAMATAGAYITEQVNADDFVADLKAFGDAVQRGRIYFDTEDFFERLVKYRLEGRQISAREVAFWACVGELLEMALTDDREEFAERFKNFAGFFAHYGVWTAQDESNEQGIPHG